MSKKDVLGLSLSEIRGPISDLLAKLDGPEGPDLLRRLKKLLRKEDPHIWKTLEVGNDPSEYLLHKLKDIHCYVSCSATNKIRAMPGPDDHAKKEIDLVRMSVLDMGFRAPVSVAEVRCWIKKNGNLCSFDDAVYLRLQYVDQPLNEVVFVPGLIPYIYGFVLKNQPSNGLMLDTFSQNDTISLAPAYQVVFLATK